MNKHNDPDQQKLLEDLVLNKPSAQVRKRANGKSRPPARRPFFSLKRLSIQSWPMSDKLSLYSLAVGILGVVIAIIALPQFASVRPLFRPILAYTTKTGNTCTGPRVLPQSVDPLHLSPEAIRLLQSIREEHSDNPVLPPLGQTGSVISILSNTANDNVQIAINSTVTLSVQHKEIPKDINVISYNTCGSAYYLEYVEYNNIPLNLARSIPNRKIQYQDKQSIYFPLQPGETKPFIFHFDCQDSGLYSITIELEYSYAGNAHTAKTADNVIIACPERFLRWDVSDTQALSTGVLPRFANLPGAIDKIDIHAAPGEASPVLATIHDKKELTIFGDYTTVNGKIWAHVKVNATGAEGWTISH